MNTNAVEAGHHSGYVERLKEAELDLRAIVGLIRMNAKFIIIVTGIVFLLGTFYAVTRAPRYQSSALIEIEGNHSNVSSLVSALGAMGGGRAAGGFRQASPADVETSLLRSRYILGAVANELGLDVTAAPKRFPLIGHLFAKTYHGKGVAAPFMGFSSYAWGGERIQVAQFTVPYRLVGQAFTVMAKGKGEYDLLTSKGQVLLSGKVGQLEKVTYQSWPVSINVQKLRATSGTEFIVEKRPLANAAGGLLGGLSIQEQGQNTGVLRIAYTGSNPAQAQKVLDIVLAVTVAKNIEKKSAEAAKTLGFLTHQLPGVQNRLNYAETTLNQYRSKSGAVDTQTEAQILLHTIASNEQSLETLKMQKLTLLQKFTPQHPFVVAIDQKEKQTAKQLDRLEKQLRQLPISGQKTLNLERNVKVRSSIYSIILKNMQQLQMLKGGTISDVRVLSTASYPASPVPSKKSLVILLSFLVGLLLSISFLVMRKALSPVIDDPDVVEAALGIPTMAIVAHSKAQGDMAKEMERRDRSTEKAYLLAHEKSKDLSIEALRSLRTGLKLSQLKAENNIISITGSSPDIGKSFIAANLAAVFSDLESKVLLIDADMRKGYAYQYVGKQKTPGLSELLEGEVSIGDAVQVVTANRFDFLSTGKYPKNPAELLMKDCFQELLQTFSKIYDLIIIDTPPVLAVTDAAIILKHSANNLLVIGAGKDQLKELEHAKRMVEKAGGNITGLVFNNMNSQHAGYGYGKYNYYYAYEKDNG